VKVQLEEELQESFRFYKKLLGAGVYYNALTYLAEIFHCLPALDDASDRRWTNTLRSEKLSAETLNAAIAGIEKDAQIIRRILSVGAVWNDDEILLVLTKRVQIDLLLVFLTEFCSYDRTVNIGDIDERINSISQTKENKHTFEEARNLMKKNWGLPIKSKWLSTEFESK
jgi:hypothetical protein